MALAPAFGVEMNWLAFGYCVVAAMILVGIVSLCVSGIRALLRRSTAFFLVFTAASSLTSITAQKTNNVNNLPPQQMMAGGGSFLTGFTGLTGLSEVGAADIARGWRVESVTTNAAVSYVMPTNAATVGNWHVHGAASSFGKNKVDFGVMRTSGTLVPTNWSFPLGTNDEAFSSFWYFVDGRIRPMPKDAERQICAVGVPMSAVPGQSRLWWLDGDDGSRIITWENFFFGGDTIAECKV
jgi:hypothetical protein